MSDVGKALNEFLNQIFPKVVDFLSNEEQRNFLSVVAKSTKEPPKIDHVEFDENTGKVFVIVVLEPNTGVDIQEYANGIAVASQLILQLLYDLVGRKS